MEQFSTSQHIASEVLRQFLHAGQRRPVPIRNESGRVVGSVRMVNGRCTFLKTVHPERHQLRHPPAWTTDCTALTQAAEAGAELVCIRERGTGRLWWAPVSAFAEHGFSLSRGHGEQIGLPLAWWTVEDPTGPQQVPLYPEADS